jgi:hypothetical protein
MGTGCVEPLLFEILEADIITHIILIGTAGLLADDPQTLGKILRITEAFPGGCAVHLKEENLPLRPNFPASIANPLPDAAIISTDYYYGFSQSSSPGVKALHAADPSLARDVASLWNRAKLVDMETAQFYHFCKTLPPRAIHYLSLKGAANSLKDVGHQTERSLKILEDCLRDALQLLSLTPLPAPPQAAIRPIGDAPAPTGDATKLTEEVKLIWQIQLGVAAVLGYLGTNLQLNPESSSPFESSPHSYLNIKNILLCGIAILILMIGSMYNLVGNFYTQQERLWIGRKADQENLVVNIFGGVYTLVFGAIAWVIWASYAGPQEAFCFSRTSAEFVATGCLINIILWIVVARYLNGLKRSSATAQTTL